MAIDNFSPSDKDRIAERAGGQCENPECGIYVRNPIHHIFFKSQYLCKADRSKNWNGANLCEDCHRILHFAYNDDEVFRSIRLDFFLKTRALKLYCGKNRTSLEYVLNKVKYKLKQWQAKFKQSSTDILSL